MVANKNRSFGVTIKTTKVVNGVTTITSQTNKSFGKTVTTTSTINNQVPAQETSSLIQELTTQVSQLATNSNNSIDLLQNSFNILTGSLNTISTTVSLLSGSTNNTIITLPSSISSSKSIHYRELTSSINPGDTLKFNTVDFSVINFKNNVSVFANGVRLNTDFETENPEVFLVSGSKDTIKFNIDVPNNSLITLEVFGSIFI